MEVFWVLIAISVFFVLSAMGGMLMYVISKTEKWKEWGNFIVVVSLLTCELFLFFSLLYALWQTAKVI